MSQNEFKGTSSKSQHRNASTNEGEGEGNEEFPEKLTHEYMESYLDRAQKDIQRLIDRSSEGSSSVIHRQQLNKINELPISSGSYIDEDGEACGGLMWIEQKIIDPSITGYSLSAHDRNDDQVTEQTASLLLNKSPDANAIASNKLNKDNTDQNRYATSSPIFDVNGNIIRPPSRRTSFQKITSGKKLLNESRDELYQDSTLKSNSPTETCSSKLSNRRHYNRLQSPIGTLSSSNISLASNKLHEGENIIRKLQSSPIRPSPIVTQQLKHVTRNERNSQIFDSAAARRASLGTNTATDRLEYNSTDKSKESPSGLTSQEFNKLRLSGSDLHIPRSSISSNRKNSKTGRPILSRTSIGQFTNLISGSNHYSSSDAISKANVASSSDKSSPLRSLSPASSGPGLFNIKRSFLSFDAGRKNDRGSTTNLNEKTSTMGDQSKKSSAYSSMKARRSIASPLSFSTSIGGIFSGSKYFQQQSSLSSVASSNASLSVDSIPNTVASQRDMPPEQSSSAITALVTAAVGSHNSFYENVDCDPLESTNKRVNTPNERRDTKGLKPESIVHGRSMSISNDDASSRWPSHNERAKLQQPCTESRHQRSSKGHLVPLFGCDINSIELLTKVGLTLPPVIDSAMQHILTNGINSVGIFRKSGVKSRIMNLRQRIESNQDIKFETIEKTEFSVYDVADFIKMWFRELKPSPILTRELIKLISSNIALIKSQKQINSSFTDASTCNTSSSSLLSSLPASSTCKQAFTLRNQYSDFSQRINGSITSTHRAILIRVLKFFSRIASKCEANQMTAQNLAICLTPSLCYTEADQQSIMLAQKALEYCINNYESLFIIKPAIYSNQRSNSLIDGGLATRNSDSLIELSNTQLRED